MKRAIKESENEFDDCVPIGVVVALGSAHHIRQGAAEEWKIDAGNLIYERLLLRRVQTTRPRQTRQHMLLPELGQLRPQQSVLHFSHQSAKQQAATTHPPIELQQQSINSQKILQFLKP
jgi:hypothetical protein